MSSDYKFVSTDTDSLINLFISACEAMTGVTVQPASPEMLFILWVADMHIQTREMINYAANQNIPGRASGENLDALAEIFYTKDRPEATTATCIMRFYISEPQASSILVPAGTRVTNTSRTLYWETIADAYVAVGGTYTDAQVICQTVGGTGNGYKAGQINNLVDVYQYYKSCENITESDGGADEATDTQFYDLLRASMAAYSTAGPRDAYRYWAMQVSTDIADVKAITPRDPVTHEPMEGYVYIYTLMSDGTGANETIKALVLDACSADEVRPLNDYVSAQDPVTVNYNIDLTFHIPTDATSSGKEIAASVEKTVEDYVSWQCGKLGRDINPSKLTDMLMDNGIKRVEIREPVFTVLQDGRTHEAPEVAHVVSVSIVNGGYEYE